MKRFFICTMIASLATLMSCNNDEVMNLAPANGEKVTVTANIKGTAATRVALTPDNTNPAQPTIKVDWNASGETFKAYAEGSNDAIVFTQTADTEDSPNLFEATLPETAPASYTVIYGDKNFTAQDGTLNQENCVLMQAIVTDNFASAIDFEHQTAILKPTFKIGGTTLTNNTITQIKMGGIKQPTADATTGAITVKPTALDDIYIFLPAYEAYTGPHTFNFTVVVGDAAYEAMLTIPEGKNIEAGKLYTATIALTKVPPYLTFTATGMQTFTMLTSDYSLDDRFQISVDYGEWQTAIAGEEIAFGGTNGNLRLRGKSSRGTADGLEQYTYIQFGNATPVACTGDIHTLVDWENYATVGKAETAATEEEEETAETARFCKLFQNCTQLTSAPALPATTLADYAYAHMFYGCTALETAPALPATTLGANCYQQMFRDCSALKTAPELPATTLAENCYYYMFRGCTSLTTAPEISATTLANSSCLGMFQYCTALETAPKLPATNLAEYCYKDMFYGCTALKTAPELPATTLGANCYQQMFYECTALKKAPELPATTLAANCYSYMFCFGTALETAPELPATNLTASCYRGLFRGCTSLKTAPELPAATLAEDCYSHMFYGCTALETAPELPATTLAEHCYDNMFCYCTALETAPTNLPATTLTESCYNSMFRDCSALKTAPELPATTLASYCYYQMFYRCSKLSSITMLATNISGSTCLKQWVSGVAANGTFTKAKGMEELPEGVNGIPAGWSIVEL